VIAEVLPGKPAETAGLIAGDRIASVDGEQVLGFPQLEAHLLANAHRPVVIGIERDGGFISVPIQPKLETEEDGTTSARIGVRLSSLLTVRQDPFSQIWEHMTALGTALRGLISPNSDIGLRHMSGPVGIAHGLHNLARVSFLLVLWFVVLINVNLALINLLPIPVLDGGHMLFATIAKLRGRDLPGEWVQSLQAAFMIALLGAAVYVTFFDGTRLVRDLSESARPAPQATDPQTADTPETVP
jgi:regulator of sigma E protease